MCTYGTRSEHKQRIINVPISKTYINRLINRGMYYVSCKMWLLGEQNEGAGGSKKQRNCIENHQLVKCSHEGLQSLLKAPQSAVGRDFTPTFATNYAWGKIYDRKAQYIPLFMRLRYTINQTRRDRICLS